MRASTSAVEASGSTTGNQARRACLAAACAASAHRRWARSTRSPFHWVTQLAAAQGTMTSTPISVEQLDRQLAAISLRECLHDDDAGLRGRLVLDGLDRHVERTAVDDGRHRAGHPPTLPVDEVESLAHGQPADRHRMPSFGTVESHESADRC